MKLRDVALLSALATSPLACKHKDSEAKTETTTTTETTRTTVTKVVYGEFTPKTPPPSSHTPSQPTQPSYPQQPSYSQPNYPQSPNPEESQGNDDEYADDLINCILNEAPDNTPGFDRHIRIENHRQIGPDEWTGEEVRSMDFNSNLTQPSQAKATVRRPFLRKGETIKQEGINSINIEAFGKRSSELFSALIKEAAQDCRKRVGRI